MHNQSFYIVNSITLYRLIAAPILLLIAFFGYMDLFKWLLTFSFLTDAMDGFLARRLKVKSAMGAKLDSIADDLTVAVAISGLFLYWPDFIYEQSFLIATLFVLYSVQTMLSLRRYGKISGFHTYLGKAAAVAQGIFLTLVFFYEPILSLFYLTVFLTAIDILEEILLVILLPHWKTDVKGLYWILKGKASGSS